MCCNFPTIKITEGNAFTLIFPLKRRSYVAKRPIDEDIDVTRLTDVRVTLGGVEYAPTIETYGVRIDVPATLSRGTYDGLLTADYDGNAIRGAYESCVQIVAWNAQSNAQQYILGSPVATEAAYVLGYMPTDEEVESLKQQLREQIAAAEQAEAEAIAEKERYAEAIEHLDDIAQESTLTQGVSDIRNDIANIDIDTTTLAKESTAQQAATDAAAAKVAAQELSPIALAADAYNTGKVELAANITAKGVEASASETLPQLAQKVSSIAQRPIILSPSEVGDMYAKQLYGSLTTPNYWNLYEVLNTLLNEGRLINYGGILLAEYYRGYDSIALSGAGAGGAYVVSDVENGEFKMYTEDTTHVWATEFDGKGDRWVAYCFADEYHDFQITNTDTSPRSIFIGRKVGTITNVVNGRISKIVVPNGNEMKFPVFKGYANAWDKNIVLRNITGGWVANLSNYEFYQISANSLYLEVSGRIHKNSYKEYALISNCSIPAIIIKTDSIIRSAGQGEIIRGSYTFICLQAEEINTNGLQSTCIISGTVYELCLISETVSGNAIINSGDITKKLYLGYITNDKTRTVSINIQKSGNSALNDIVLQHGWCKPLYISSVISNLTEENMYAHILQRLKQDEPDCGDGVTITIGQTNLDKLTSAESIALLDDLTNIYGYTFA